MSPSSRYNALFDEIRTLLLDKSNLGKYLIVFPNAQNGWSVLIETPPPDPHLIASGTGRTVSDALELLLQRAKDVDVW